MKFENFSARSNNLNQSALLRTQSLLQSQQNRNNLSEATSSLPLTNANLRRQRHSGNGAGGGGLFGCGYSDKDSICSANSSIRGKRIRSRNIPMKSSKSVMKKSKVMDYTNYAYNEAVGRLKLMLADSYAAPSKGSFGGGSGFGGGGAYLRNYSEDSADNFSDNLSVIERPIYSDISKYLSPSQKTRFGSSFRSSSRKPLSGFSSSKENLALPTTATHYLQQTTAATAMPHLNYSMTAKPQQMPADSVQAPVEIFNFIEKQEDYIEQLEKESKYCRNELSNLLGKVKDVIHENEHLTETARSELAALSGAEKSKMQLSPSSEDSEATVYAAIKKPTTPRKKEIVVKSPRYANAPSIVYEARISELEAELTQANIDLKRMRSENEELKRKLAKADPVAALTDNNKQLVSVVNCDVHRKQIENLQMEKQALEDTVRHLQKSLDEAKSQQYNLSSKRYVNDLLQMERSQAELEVKHLRDELDRQHERVRELQHEMARRIAEERANAERRYNNQVDQLGGDLSNQWEQVAKLQLDLERQKRYETDLKRDLANRNAQIEELKMELRSNRSTFLADMAQTSAEKQSLEQEITALRLQLDRAAREAKTETSRYNAEINSLRQRLDRGDADLLHAKREILRLNDEIANLEKELAYGEMKNEIRPTKKDLDQRISELQEKHAETVNELEQMIQNQKQLMDKLTTECKVLTNRLEDTTLKQNQDKQRLRETNIQLLDRLKQIWASYKDLSASSSKHSLQKRRHSICSLSNSSSAASGSTASVNCEEAQFSEQAPNTIHLIKPLSTTSRPCLMQPAPISQQRPSMAAASVHRALPQTVASMITASQSAAIQAPTTMTACSATAAVTTPSTPTAQQAAQSMHSEQRQILQRLQQRLLHMTQANTSQQQSQQAAAAMAITNLVTTTANMDSAIMTTRILKTTSVQVRSNNCSNQAITTEKNHQALKQELVQQQQLEEQEQEPSTPTWVPVRQASQITAPPIIAATEGTIQHNTIPHNTIPANMIRRNMMPVNMQVPMIKQADKATIQMPHMPIIAQRITMPAPINNTSKQQQQRAAHQQQRRLQHKQQQVNQLGRHQQRQQRNRLPVQQHQQHQRQQQAAQQQKVAAYNRARALELWGQQVALQPPENPRPLLKSNYDSDNSINIVDPLELELSISSPSLLRSSLDSDSDRTENAEVDDFDSISDMSISPAPTAVRLRPVSPNSTIKSDATYRIRSSNTL